jgi:hypothetical protein
MSAFPAPTELDPLASARLRRRFPQLGTALDVELMRGHLQDLLFDGTGMVTRACGRPRAEVEDGVCRLQYPLQVDTPSGERREVLVLGTMFATSGAAAGFERDRLSPLATQRPALELPAARATGVLEPLRMAVSVFPVSDVLPTLLGATDSRRMTEALRSILPARDRSAVAGIELVRFRRTRGCVLRYRLAPGGDHAVVYGKVGYAACAEDVQDGLDALAGRDLPLMHRSILFPRVLGHSAEHDVTFISSIPGSRPDLRVESVLDAAVERAAHVAASLHTSGVALGRPRTLDGELARARAAVGLIRRDAVPLAAWLAEVVDRLGAVAEGTPPQSPTLAHGDFTPSQLLDAGSQVGILDFDGMCQAEPALDLGRYLAYLRMTVAKSGSSAGDAVTSRFLATYLAVGGRPASEARAEIYAMTSLVRMAAHGWQQLKPARLRLACAVLERQVARLDTLRTGGARVVFTEPERAA